MHDLFFNSRISYILQVIPVTIFAGILYILVCAVQKKRWDWNRVARCLFVCYMTALLNIVLTPPNFWGDFWFSIVYGVHIMELPEFFRFSCNLIPTIIQIWTGTYSAGSWVSFMMIANILLFLPFGILHPLAFPGRNTLKTGIMTIFAIELLQPIVARSFDVDDLISNGLGLLTGFGIYCILGKITRKT